MDSTKTLNKELFNAVDELMTYYYVKAENENGIDFDRLDELMWNVNKIKYIIKMKQIKKENKK